MPIIIDELQVLSDHEPERSQDPAQPRGEPARGTSDKPPKVRDVIEAERWERRRELRVRAH